MVAVAPPARLPGEVVVQPVVAVVLQPVVVVLLQPVVAEPAVGLEVVVLRLVGQLEARVPQERPRAQVLTRPRVQALTRPRGQALVLLREPALTPLELQVVAQREAPTARCRVRAGRNPADWPGLHSGQVPQTKNQRLQWVQQVVPRKYPEAIQWMVPAWLPEPKEPPADRVWQRWHQSSPSRPPAELPIRRREARGEKRVRGMKQWARPATEPVTAQLPLHHQQNEISPCDTNQLV